MKDSDINFNIYVDDPNFDNNDNPYGEIKLHKITNMDNMNDTYYTDDMATENLRDELIPFRVCNEESERWSEGK